MIDVSAGVTVRTVEPRMLLPLLLAAAVMVVVPTAIAVARPLSGRMLPTVATDGLDEVHCAELVRSLVDPSL